MRGPFQRYYAGKVTKEKAQVDGSRARNHGTDSVSRRGQSNSASKRLPVATRSKSSPRPQAGGLYLEEVLKRPARLYRGEGAKWMN